MEINSPPSHEVLDFCNSFKRSFKAYGWPNSKIETWKMTPLQKFIKDTSSLKHNSNYQIPNNKNIFIEASGGMNLTNIKPYLNTGIDGISIGALTHQIKSIDIKLEFK